MRARALSCTPGWYSHSQFFTAKHVSIAARHADGAHGAPRATGMDAKAEPLLAQRGRAPAWPCWSVVSLTLAYTLTGALERVCFARPTGTTVRLIHSVSV